MGNPYDGNTLSETFAQIERLRGKRPKIAVTDRGYRGRSMIDGTSVLIPMPPDKRATAYEKRKARMRFRRRAAIEPIIGHLKFGFGLDRNFLKGTVGDEINLMLSASAFNFKKLMRALTLLFIRILGWILGHSKWSSLSFKAFLSSS